MKAANKPIVDEAKALGVKHLFMGECGHAFRVMKKMMEPGKWWGALPFDVISCMEWTDVPSRPPTRHATRPPKGNERDPDCS